MFAVVFAAWITLHCSFNAGEQTLGHEVQFVNKLPLGTRKSMHCVPDPATQDGLDDFKSGVAQSGYETKESHPTQAWG
jgi:hypothetical protein